MADSESLIITGKTIATIIRNSTNMSPCEIKELVAKAWRECPNCKYCIYNDVSTQWPGLPAGVKFDPSDLELLRHLEAKVGEGNSASHILIDDFIPTINKKEGICYTHPENLPDIKIDGTNSYFFHTISNAYVVGKRKRRKIGNSGDTASDEPIRWHKTGSKKRGGNIEKTNWTMHQYHLGVEEDEKHGKLVVSKIFWQLRSNKTGKSQTDAVNEEHSSFAGEIDPTTPMTNPPQPRRLNSSPFKTEQHQEEDEEYDAALAALLGLDEHLLSNGIPYDACPKKAPLPLDMDTLHEFSDPDVGTLGDKDKLFGSQDSFGSWLNLNDNNINSEQGF